MDIFHILEGAGLYAGFFGKGGGEYCAGLLHATYINHFMRRRSLPTFNTKIIRIEDYRQASTLFFFDKKVSLIICKNLNLKKIVRLRILQVLTDKKLMKIPG